MNLQLYTEGSDADNARQSSEEKEKDDMEIEPYGEDDPDHPNNLAFDDDNGVCTHSFVLTTLSTPVNRFKFEIPNKTSPEVEDILILSYLGPPPWHLLGPPLLLPHPVVAVKWY